MKTLLAFIIFCTVSLPASLVFAESPASHQTHGTLGADIQQLESKLDAAAEEIDEGVLHQTDESDESEGGSLPQFDPSWFASQLFWLAISFAVLYAFFAKKTLPEISAVIENRKSRIRADLEMAENLTQESENVRDTYEKSVASAHENAAQLTAKTREKLAEKAAKSGQNFQLHAEKEMRIAEQKISDLKDTLMDDMGAIAEDVAEEAVQKIIGRAADAGKIKSIVASLSNKKHAA